MIEVSTRDFRALVTPVLPVVDETDMSPLLGAIQVRSFDGKLAAIATDRYRIALQLSDIEVEFPSFLIPAKAVKLILKSFPGNKNIDAHLQISVDEGGKVIVTGETGNKWCPTLTLNISQPEGKYPDLVELISKSYHQPKIASTGVNMQMLAGFTAAAGRHATTSIELSEKKTDPIVIRVGDSFFGILMPLRGPAIDNARLAKILPVPA
jgi:hypothetical protein